MTTGSEGDLCGRYRCRERPSFVTRVISGGGCGCNDFATEFNELFNEIQLADCERSFRRGN